MVNMMLTILPSEQQILSTSLTVILERFLDDACVQSYSKTDRIILNRKLSIHLSIATGLLS